MKKFWKRTLAMLLTVLMIGGAAPLSAVAEIDWPTLSDDVGSLWVKEVMNVAKSAVFWVGNKIQGLSLKASAEAYSGSCGMGGYYLDGSNVTWMLESSTGILTIRGTGAMQSYYDANTPWSSYNSIIRTVIVENGVTRIGDYAFANCSNLTNISIPGSVTSIRDGAFFECRALSNIVIPSSITYIGSTAFEGCVSLSSIVIPSSVKTLGSGAFEECISLLTVEIGNGISSIEQAAFYNCTSLLTVTIPASVTSIKKNAFWGCTKLMSVSIPDTVIQIGDDAFRECISMEEAIIPDSVSTIGSGAFYNCKKLFKVKIGKNVKSIGSAVFLGCEQLESVSIPDSVTEIGDRAFFWCFNLSSAKIGNGVTCIGESFFYDCNSLTNVLLGNGVEKIDENAFVRCGKLKGLTIPYGVTFIGAKAFDGCVSIEEIVIPDSVENVDDGAFIRCKNLSRVVMGSGITRINSYTFYDCQNLLSVVIPNSIWLIDSYAFDNCYCLKDIYYTGTQMQWKRIVIESRNQYLNYATLYYNWDGENIDLTVLRLVSATPANGTTNASYTDNLVLTFNQDIFCRIGSVSETYDYEIAVRNYNTDEPIFSSEEIRSTFWNEATLSGNVLTIPHALLKMELGEKYYLYIGPDCFSAKNDITVHFPGITDKDAYTFICGKADPIMKKVSNIEMDVRNDEQETIGSLSVSFDPLYFEKNSNEYVDALADFCAQYLMLGYCYDEQNVINYLTKMGFSDAVANMHTSKEQVNYYIASGKMDIHGEYYTLVFVGLVGSFREQWYSNFDPDEGSTHQGFNNAKKYIYESAEKGRLSDYMKWLQSEKGADKAHTKVLVAGHSRGGAVANLVSAQLIKDQVYAMPENIYTYAFATPSMTTLDERKNSEYQRIFNIINPSDFVTWVMPAAWGYGKYGTTYLLPSKTNDANYSEYHTAMKNSYHFIKQANKDYSLLDDLFGDDYLLGEIAVDDVIGSMVSCVPSVSDYIHRWWWFPKDAFIFVTLREFFLDSICPIVAEKDTETKLIKIAGLLETLATPFSYPLFKQIIGYFILNQGVSPKFEVAHEMATYCAFMMTMDEGELTDSDKVQARNKKSLFTINCPVDVDVIEKSTGEVVGRIRNNVVNEEILAKPNSVVMTVSGDSKSAWPPSNGSYDVRLIGNGTGTMDCTVSTVDAQGTETARSGFFDVTITPGLTMSCAVPEGTFTPESATLSLADGTTIEPETLAETDLNALEIRVSTEGQGFANSLYNLTKGDYVTLTAIANTNNAFLGWYENGVQISADASCAFVAKADRDLTAKFTNNPVQTGKVQYVMANDLTLIYKTSSIIQSIVTADNDVKYTVAYSGFDNRIISVDENGNVTALKKGTTNVTVTATDAYGNTVESTCNVTVKYAWWQILIRILLLGFIWY